MGKRFTVAAIVSGAALALSLWFAARDHRSRPALAPPAPVAVSATSVTKPITTPSVLLGKKGKSEGDDVFLGTNLPSLRIEIPRAGLSRLRGEGWNGGGGEKATVQATVREGTRVYTNVAIHLKGAAGSFRPIDDQPGMTLNFDKFAPGQTFHGLTKFSLNNSVQDPSYMEEKVCRELFAMADVPVPRSGHAIVKLNGRDLGLYVLVEGFNKQFLKRYFKNTKGNLYDSEFCKDVHQRLNVNSGDNPEDQSDLERLSAITRERDPGRLWPQLTQVLDVDRFISMLVMESVTCHGDGYGPNRNNYRVFHDLDSDKMIFMPHGMDQMFGRFNASVDSRLILGTQGIVAQAVMRTPEGRKLYIDRMRYLMTNVFEVEKIVQWIYQADQRTSPYFSALGNGKRIDHGRQVDDLCRRVRARFSSVVSQLNTVNVPRQKPGGVIKIREWTPRNGTKGNIQLTQREVDGRKQLHFGGVGTGSWRAFVTLEEGTYMLSATATARNLEGGLRLRISGNQMDPFVSVPRSQELKFQFEVPAGPTDIALVCEGSLQSGEAWIDVDSIKLARVR